jgi:hypothetical protein
MAVERWIQFTKGNTSDEITQLQVIKQVQDFVLNEKKYIKPESGAFTFNGQPPGSPVITAKQGWVKVRLVEITNTCDGTAFANVFWSDGYRNDVIARLSSKYTTSQLQGMSNEQLKRLQDGKIYSWKDFYQRSSSSIDVDLPSQPITGALSFCEAACTAAGNCVGFSRSKAVSDTEDKGVCYLKKAFPSTETSTVWHTYSNI